MKVRYKRAKFFNRRQVVNNNVVDVVLVNLNLGNIELTSVSEVKAAWNETAVCSAWPPSNSRDRMSGFDCEFNAPQFFDFSQLNQGDGHGHGQEHGDGGHAPGDGGNRNEDESRGEQYFGKSKELILALCR